MTAEQRAYPFRASTRKPEELKDVCGERYRVVSSVKVSMVDIVVFLGRFFWHTHVVLDRHV
ncbi:MAG TPA: hypothetical protein VNR86_10080 [Sphingomicrobium sp.]|nr:hypothetical protein [Sphingomicrobium sp.]